MSSHTHPELGSVHQLVLRRSPAIGHEPAKMKKKIIYWNLYKLLLISRETLKGKAR